MICEGETGDGEVALHCHRVHVLPPLAARWVTGGSFTPPSNIGIAERGDPACHRQASERAWGQHRGQMNSGRSGEARASYTADYPRRGKPSPLLALSHSGRVRFFDIAGGPAEVSARP